MGEQLLRQYEMTRQLFIDTVTTIPTELINVNPSGIRNTIHWQIGHVLVIAEEIADFPNRESSRLPYHYKQWFGRGTEPKNWPNDVPDIEQLIADLKDQLNRIRQITESDRKKKLTEPFDGIEDFEEFASLALFHEAMHLGQIITMKQMIEHENIANHRQLGDM